MAEPAKRKHTIELNRVTWQRFVRPVRGFLTSEVSRKAKGILAMLIALLLAISGLNVLNSYVGRDFMTAIEDRNMRVFLAKMALYIGVFALGTIAAGLYRYSEERLGLLWREWLTRGMFNQLLNHRMYYYLNETGRIPNPDQRIAEDARAFAMKPGLLLADEPTGNLDAATGAGIIDLMFAMNAEQGTTLVLVTHDEAIARRCGRVLKLRSGELLR